MGWWRCRIVVIAVVRAAGQGGGGVPRVKVQRLGAADFAHVALRLELVAVEAQRLQVSRAAVPAHGHRDDVVYLEVRAEHAAAGRAAPGLRERDLAAPGLGQRALSGIGSDDRPSDDRPFMSARRKAAAAQPKGAPEPNGVPPRAEPKRVPRPLPAAPPRAADRRMPPLPLGLRRRWP